MTKESIIPQQIRGDIKPNNKMLTKRLLARWLEPVRNLFAKERTFAVSARVAETFALCFILITAILTYLYGTYKVLPEVFSDYSDSFHMSYRIVCTWILFCVFSNMYLVRKRTSSIRNRMLLQPVVKPMSSHVSNMDSECQVRESARHMGEHFKLKPFGEEENWHICAACETFVPPRAWHCYACQSCILRRDHHCVFTGCCIGEENQGNFLSLLFYMGLGTTISAVFSFIYSIYWENMALWWYLFRLFGLVYTIFFDFQVTQILASINSMGQMAAWGVFFYYFFAALQGKTSADLHRKVDRLPPGQSRYSFKTMSEFLGPNPLLRIIWPFHPAHRIDYNVQVNEADRIDRKGL